MRAHRVVATTVAALVVIGVLFLFVLPGRTYLAQRASLNAAETRLAVLNKQNTQLQQRIQQLQTGAEIERIARQEYGLVKPGEQAYAILPAPQSVSPTLPKKPRHGGFWTRVWNAIWS